MSNRPDIVELKSASPRLLDAADWLAKLDRGDLTAEERAAFAEWLAEAPANKQAIRDTAGLWYGLNAPLSQIDSVGISAAGLKANILPYARRGGSAPRQGGAIAAMLALAFCAALFMSRSAPVAGPDRAYYATIVGEQRVIDLPDGSEIHLNTNSIVEREYTTNVRIIRLVAGEAIFDVAHDVERPFVVYAADGVIRAVGTRFAVRVEQDRLSVTVTEGKVAMQRRMEQQLDIVETPETAPAPREVFVVAGEQAEIERTADASKQPVTARDMEVQLSWANGQLVFNDEYLESVIAEVSRYTTIDIRFRDETLKAKKITGILPLGDVNQMLEGIGASLGIKSNWESPDVVYLTAG